MKRWITVLVVMAMVFGLCACGSSGNAEGGTAATGGLQIGYAKIDITPKYPIGLGGYSNAETRISEGFLDYIYSTCIAATSGDETILIFTIDNCAMTKGDADKIRARITEATGIPGEKIFCGATHGHNCPSLNGGYENAAKYREDLYKGTLEAAQKALEDRSPATMLQAKAEHEGLNFVRHYTLDDGSFTDTAGAKEAGLDRLVGHPMESDKQMVMLKFDREGDKKDILMVNWQAHPDNAQEIGFNQISPSWIGPMRNKLEKDTGMHVAYFTGASGNQVMVSLISAETHGYTYKQYGEALADCAFSMIEKLEPVEGTAIKTTHCILPVNVDHSWDHMLNQANEVYDLWKSTNQAVGDTLARQYGMSSSFHARAIRSKAAMGATIDMELNAFSIGEVGFTTGTYEMFSCNGMFVKEHSPFETTFIITGNSSYVPSDIAYTYRGYEADTGYYARGVGETLADKYVEMLGQVK